MKVSLTELEDAAKALEVNVTYEDLKTSKGGSCRVMETRRIIIQSILFHMVGLGIVVLSLIRRRVTWRDRSSCARRFSYES